MKSHRLRLWLAVVLSILSLVLLTAATLPLARSRQVIPFPLSAARVRTARLLAPLPMGAILPTPFNILAARSAQASQPRQIVLEWPHAIRLGDRDQLRLSIEIDQAAAFTQAAESSQVNRVAVARLELTGLEAYREEMREPLRPGQPLRFHWDLHAVREAAYRGTVWLHIDHVPQDGSLPERQLILARPIEIEVVRVLGLLPASLARAAGSLGLALSTALGYPALRAARRASPEQEVYPPEG